MCMPLPHALKVRGARAGGRVDAVICVGCLIKGETMHFEYIAGAVADGIMKVQLDTGP
jgi:6,7-dimethyl-8-ribityllumazine synthase